MRAILAIPVLALATAAGCSRDSTVTVTKLGALPLEGAVVDPSKIVTAPVDAPYPIAVSPTLSVELSGPSVRPPPVDTLDQAKAAIAHQSSVMIALTRQDATTDGWVLAFTRDTNDHPLYGATVRRTIAGQPWDCDAHVVSDRDELAAAIAFCQSLRAAP